MSLTNILKGIGRRILGGRKESATPATGQQTKQITYTPKPSQEQAKDLVTQELKNPPVVLKKTKPLQMGDDTAPAFGSSTYDWVMRKGRGQYTADEWIDHLTSTRKVNFTVFGRPSTRLERAEKRFKYDSGPFAGKEVNISKEELFDTNLATFNEKGDLTGGMLAAAKKFGIKLNANDIGAMIKLNPLNRLKPIELGANPAAEEAFEVAAKNARNTIRDLQVKYKGSSGLKESLDDLQYELNAGGVPNKAALRNINDRLKDATRDLPIEDRKTLNKVIGEINNKAGPMVTTRTKYGTETSYTLQGGKNYRETVMTLPEEISTNRSPFNQGGHFTDVVPKDSNNIYHIRFDTRFTPDGKKVFFVNEIQSDVNQSVAKNLNKLQQLDPNVRINPFQKDIELKLLLNERNKIIRSLDDAQAKGDSTAFNAIANEGAKIQRQLTNMVGGGSRSGKYDYFPMVEADQYGDHALKYLMQRAARENVDYVAVAPFDKVSFRQGYKAGNERFYGYASGKGINKSGSAVMPNLMKRAARLYGSKAGPTKVSLSDPSRPYKTVRTEEFKYPDKHKLSGKRIKSTYHENSIQGPSDDYTFIEASNPDLYFDAFAIKVNPLMRGTQKTYKALGGLVVDIFKPIRYN
jgi:hypothetical protein